MNARIRRFLFASFIVATARGVTNVPPSHADRLVNIAPMAIPIEHGVTPTIKAEEGSIVSEETEPPSSSPAVHSRAIYNQANEAAMKAIAANQYGWVGTQWIDLQTLMMHESGFDDRVVNPSSGAAGIGQNINGLAGYPDPSAKGQINWTLAYIANRYGNPSNALYFWASIAPTKPPYNGHWY